MLETDGDLYSDDLTAKEILDRYDSWEITNDSVMIVDGKRIDHSQLCHEVKKGKKK